MRKLNFKLDRRSLQTIYFSFIRPLLEYADVVRDNCTQYEVKDLEKIQNEAARIVSGATKLVSINSLSLETGWESLSSRGEKYTPIIFKMQNNLAPDYLSSLVPPTVGSTSAYSIRNSSNLHTLHAKSQLDFNSFLSRVILNWNDLPEEVRFSSSLDASKYKLNRDVIMPPKFYFTGKRLEQIYHARLQTNCSLYNR